MPLRCRFFGLWTLFFFALLVPCCIARRRQASEKSPVIQSLITEMNDALNKSVSPCEDFYQYSCGNFLAKVKIPSGFQRMGKSFTRLAVVVQKKLRKILEGGKLDKISQFYADCMNITHIDKLGVSPLKPLMDSIQSIHDHKSMVQSLATLHRRGFSPFWSVDSDSDYKDPSVMVLSLTQGGSLSFPDRDYFLKDKYKEKREKLFLHIAHIFQLADLPEFRSYSFSASIIKLETEMAKIQRSKVERRDPTQSHFPLPVDKVGEFAGNFDWDEYFSNLGNSNLKRVNLMDRDYIRRLTTQVLPKAPLEELKAYMLWKILKSTSSLLSQPFRDAHFEFYGKEVKGVQEKPPRWKTCVGMTSVYFSDLVSKHYAEIYFPPQQKESAGALIKKIEDQMRVNLNNLQWMDNTTRSKALQKLDKLENQIGFPKAYFEYETVHVLPNSFFVTALKAKRYMSEMMIKKSTEAPEKWRFLMSSNAVNAYYTSNFNQMVFPAGILQPPFFHAEYPDAVNFGGIGSVMGHELTHGFDDKGSQFDAFGVLKNWWQPESLSKFKNLTKCVADEYSTFTTRAGQVNGKLTCGENIADLGGIKLSYLALKKTLPKGGLKQPSVVEGFTNEQLFFLSFSQLWCEKVTEKGEKFYLSFSVHSPNQFRVNGVLRNTKQFGSAFNCPVGSFMNPEKKCLVW